MILVSAIIVILVSTMCIQPIAAASKSTALRITTANLPAWISGTQAKFQLIATGGTPPLVWTVKSGKLPSGFALSSDGVLSGMSILSSGVTKKVFAPVVIQVKDKKGKMKTAKFSITVKPSPPSIAITNPSDLTVGQSVDETIATVTGGISPYRFATQAASGPMPFGMQITTVGSEAHLTGAPKAKGHFAFRLCVTDSTKTQKCGDIAFDVKDKVTSETWQGTFTTAGRCVCTHASGDNNCDSTDGSVGGTMTFTFTVPEPLTEEMKRTDRYEAYQHKGKGTWSGSETVAKQQPHNGWDPTDCVLVGGSVTNAPIEVTVVNGKSTDYGDQAAAVIDIGVVGDTQTQPGLAPGGRQTQDGTAGQIFLFRLLIPSLTGTQFSGNSLSPSPGMGTFTLTKVQ